MGTLELLLEATGIGDPGGRPRRDSRFLFGYDPLEARPLMAAAVPAAPAPIAPAVVGGTATTPAGGTVGSLQLPSPVGNLLAGATQFTASFYQSGPISLASGLLGFPISTLLSPTVTTNQTPLDNGTPFTGTVWITEAPQPSGIFHFGTTLSPVFSDLYLQTVNPQGGPPSFTHFGEDSDGSLNGVEIQEPVAVGPIGPSITIEITPAQPPPVAAQQLVGPPTQLQQDETTTQTESQTPPGGVQGADQPMTPGTGGQRGPTPPFVRRWRPMFGGGTGPAPVMPILPPGRSVGLLPPETEAARPPAGRQPGAPGVPPPAGPGPQGAPGARPAREQPRVAPGAPSMDRTRRVAPGARPVPEKPPAAPGARPVPEKPPAAPGAQPVPEKPPAAPDAPPADQESRGTQPPPVRPQGDPPGAGEEPDGSSGDTAFRPGPREDGTSFAIELIDAAIPGLVERP